MNSLLEDYLTKIAAHITSLPKARRDEELRELREHLLIAVAANQAQGQSEDGATRMTLEQFGAPEGVGRDIANAWQRGELIRKRSFWGAVAATPVVLGYLMYLLVNGSLIEQVWPSFNAYFLLHRAFGEAIIHGTFFLLYGLTGMVVGGVFPKQAVKGICLGLVFFTLVQHLYPDDVLWWLVLALSAAAVGVAFSMQIFRRFCFVLVIVALVWMGGGSLTVPTHLRQFLCWLEELGWLLTAVLGACVSSRWRLRHTPLIRA